MSNELLLINPRRRRRKTVRRRRRNPNGRAATARRTVARATGARVGLTRRANPMRRRRPSYRRRPVARRRSAAARRYQRNPARMTMRGVMNSVVVPAFQAGLGALALDVTWGYVPVPIEWKTGNLRHIVKGGGALVLGMLAQQVLGARIGNNIALGALTVTFHDAMRDMVAQFAPQIPLGYVGPAVNAGNYGGPQTYNYPGGDPMLQGMNGLGYYVGSPGSAAAPMQVPLPTKREEENMGYYTG